MIQKILALIGVLTLSAAIHAETRYVSDSQYVPIRSGAGNQFRIINKGLHSGTKLTLIEEQGEWSQIETAGGTKGWIRTQYLKKTPTARLRLNEVQKQLTLSTQKIDTLEETLKKLNEEHRSLSTTSTKSAKAHSQLSEKYKQLKSLSEGAVNLNTRYQAILEKHEMLKTEFDTIRAENDRLKSEKTINQWLFGAGLIILGMILMLILPALKPQKGNGDWVN